MAYCIGEIWHSKIMSNKLNKIEYLISYLQYAFLNDVEVEAVYFSRFPFHYSRLLPHP